MYLRYRCALIALLTIGVMTIGLTNQADARPFKRIKVMELKYAWGTSSMAEFDYYDTMYPGYLPTAAVTSYPGGTFTAVNNASGQTGVGIYTKQGGVLTITIIPDGPAGTVQYVGQKV